MYTLFSLITQHTLVTGEIFALQLMLDLSVSINKYTKCSVPCDSGFSSSSDLIQTDQKWTKPWSLDNECFSNNLLCEQHFQPHAFHRHKERTITSLSCSQKHLSILYRCLVTVSEWANKRRKVLLKGKQEGKEKGKKSQCSTLNHKHTKILRWLYLPRCICTALIVWL